MYDNIKQNNMKQSCPATQALIALEDTLPEPEYIKRAMKGNLTPETGEQPGSKRRKSCIESTLDLFDILSSMKPVEDSIAFPTIEWAYDDDEDQEPESANTAKSCCSLDFDDEDDYPSFSRPYCSTSSLGKRSRTNGLSRSKSQKISLLSLVSTIRPSSGDLRAQCMSSLNASTLPIFSLGSLVGDDSLVSNEAIKLALETLVA
jgi:hypothetical protein